MPFLKIKLSGKPDQAYALRGQRITIGRRPDNTVQIIDRSVSAYHAELLEENGHYRLRDLRSTNCCFVEGRAVTDFHLLENCKIAFGAVECEFDIAASPEPDAVKLSDSRMEHEVAFLRSENAVLTGKVIALERRIEMLSSAQLIGGKTEVNAVASGDALAAAVAERNDLRRQLGSISMEFDAAREALAIAVRERDAAREAAERVRTEKLGVARLSSTSGGGPSHTPVAGNRQSGSPAASSASAQRIRLLLPPPFDQLTTPLREICTTIEQLAGCPHDAATRSLLHLHARHFSERIKPLRHDAISRVSTAFECLANHVALKPEAADYSAIRTLAKAAELLSRLIDPRAIDLGFRLETATALVVDDDVDLLATIVSALELAEIKASSCETGEAAIETLTARRFDSVLLDAGLPGIDGPGVCVAARELAHHARTPIIFVTGTNTIDKRAEVSLSGGNDFLRKPFDISELILKAQIWVTRNQVNVF